MPTAGEAKPPVEVFTDGACSGNPGPGGWAWAVPDGPQASGSEDPSTNQRMEVHAVLDALQTLLAATTRPIRVTSDSTYVVKCFNDSWWKGWMARGWRNSQKQAVANQDLWKPLIELYRANTERITFRWVKGHSGNRLNDLVDRLAVAAASARSPRLLSGADLLLALGPDVAAASSAPEPSSLGPSSLGPSSLEPSSLEASALAPSALAPSTLEHLHHQASLF